MERSHGGERGSNGGERRGWRIQERMALELPWSKGKENKRQLSSDIIDKRWPTLEGGDMRGEEEEKRRRRGGEEKDGTSAHKSQNGNHGGKRFALVCGQWRYQTACCLPLCPDCLDPSSEP